MYNSMNKQRCVPCEGIGASLNDEQINNLMPQLTDGWQVVNGNKSIRKIFQLDNFFETMSFVNAIAWIAHIENHHPDLEIGYNYCRVLFMTHALDGLSHNDFICASKIDNLLAITHSSRRDEE